MQISLPQVDQWPSPPVYICLQYANYLWVQKRTRGCQNTFTLTLYCHKNRLTPLPAPRRSCTRVNMCKWNRNNLAGDVVWWSVWWSVLGNDDLLISQGFSLNFWHWVYTPKSKKKKKKTLVILPFLLSSHFVLPNILLSFHLYILSFLPSPLL